MHTKKANMGNILNDPANNFALFNKKSKKDSGQQTPVEPEE